MQDAVPTLTAPLTGTTISPDAADGADAAAGPRRRVSGTLAVLLMLVLAAAAFSYLWAYAAPDALIEAGLLSPWADGTDPRPRRLGLAFASVLGAFLTVGMLARVLSHRQLRRIDAMTEE